MKLPIVCVKSLMRPRTGLFVALFAFFSVSATGTVFAASSGETRADRQHAITIYDQGEKRVVLTKTQTVGDTLKQADISLAPHDRVEPAADTTYASQNYTVNIYRARPVMVVDGMKREQVLTPYSSPSDIAKDAGLSVRDEDELMLSQSEDVLTDGVGSKLVIDRAIPVTLSLYGAPSQIYTHASTVENLLSEKGVKLGASDSMSVAQSTPVTAGMTIEIWREGLQTSTVQEDIPFASRQILDADQPTNYRSVQTPGIAGKKSVVYEIIREGGKEVSRKVIQSVTLQEPKEQVEVIGSKGSNPLTKSKGAQQFTDSRGIVHRETYYDLPMNVTMGACGGGDYTIRADGAKVDKDGYILIAANLSNYPRCSVVETSMGPGKVYDTGGFAAVHPHGFDLATDWTNGDGR